MELDRISKHVNRAQEKLKNHWKKQRKDYKLNIKEVNEMIRIERTIWPGPRNEVLDELKDRKLNLT